MSIWDRHANKLVHAGVYATHLEASVAYDVMRIMIDRRLGLVTMQEKLNHPIDSYDVVLSRQETHMMRKLKAAAIATRGGPDGPATMSALNRLRLRIGRVVVVRVAHLSAAERIETNVDEKFRKIFE